MAVTTDKINAVFGVIAFASDAVTLETIAEVSTLPLSTVEEAVRRGLNSGRYIEEGGGISVAQHKRIAGMRDEAERLVRYLKKNGSATRKVLREDFPWMQPGDGRRNSIYAGITRWLEFSGEIEVARNVKGSHEIGLPGQTAASRLPCWKRRPRPARAIEEALANPLEKMIGALACPSSPDQLGTGTRLFFEKETH